ncbi:MAG: hypothetical protein WB626_04210 [Bacteroidota bacterium]
MIRHTIIAAALVFLIGPPLAAQDETIPPVPPQRSRAARIGAFGGVTPGWLFLDVKPFNEFLEPAGAAPLADDGVVLWGGAGAAYIMFVPNLRVGGMGMGGSLRSTALDAEGVRRDAELGVGFGGVTVEYVVPILERLDVAFGAMLGGGGVDLTLRQDVGGAKTWDREKRYFTTGDYRDNAGTGQIGSISRKLSGAFFVWVPSVHVEYGFLGWVGARLGVSYVGMTAPSWSLDDRYDLLGVPSGVHGRGVMVNAGLFLGTF